MSHDFEDFLARDTIFHRCLEMAGKRDARSTGVTM